MVKSDQSSGHLASYSRDSRAPRALAYLFLPLVIMFMAALAGCSPGSGDGAGEGSDDSDPAESDSEVVSERPDRPADLVGTVVPIEQDREEAPLQSSNPAPARVLVEGRLSPDAASEGGRGSTAKGDRYLLNLKITAGTRILLQESNRELSKASALELTPGKTVEVWHSPEVGRSYPGLARAQTIIVE